jgi:hypothetical protein
MLRPIKHWYPAKLKDGYPILEWKWGSMGILQCDRAQVVKRPAVVLILQQCPKFSSNTPFAPTHLEAPPTVIIRENKLLIYHLAKYYKNMFLPHIQWILELILKLLSRYVKFPESSYEN